MLQLLILILLIEAAFIFKVVRKDLARLVTVNRQTLFPDPKDLIKLTKPGIVILLLITTIFPMFIAKPYELTTSGVLLTLLGGYLLAGSANVFNCIWDIDIDRIMKRTQSRPLPAERVSINEAVLWGLILGISGTLLFFYLLNPLAAFMAVCGHIFYVMIYTIVLKRNTPQNIVIGGAAGAFPPLVGWAAATGEISVTAILLFWVIFFWTPPHFWALALVKNEDYKRAGIPMMPLIRGQDETIKLMLIYAVCLLPLSVILLALDPRFGWFAWLGLLGLSGWFCLLVWKLKKTPSDTTSWAVFKFSLIYLTAYFATLMIDLWI